MKEAAPLSRLSETLIGSEIVKLGGEIRDKINQGEKIYNFTIGDFDPAIFPIPQKLEDLIVASYRSKMTNYPPADGLASLRKAVGAFIEKYENLTYQPDEILVAAGGRPLIYGVYRALVDAGDKVIYPVPSWNNNHYVHFTSGKHVVIEAGIENNFMPTARQIAEEVEGAVLLALCSPLNPTGTVFKKQQLEEICDVVLEENKRRGPGQKKLYVLYDQMYHTLTYGNHEHHTPVGVRPAMREYTIFIDGISKAFAATGVRVGWAMGPSNVLAKMRAINGHVGAWSPLSEQDATAKYLTDFQDIESYLSVFKQKLYERLKAIHDGFVALKNEGFKVDVVAPEAALYLTIRLSLKGMATTAGKQLQTQAEVTQYILDEAGLAIVPFSAFGASANSDWYRLSVGTCREEQIAEMLERLRGALESLV